MGPFAVITREPEIGLSEWLDHIASNLALVRPPEREIDNPLKPGAKAIIRPGRVLVTRAPASVPFGAAVRATALYPSLRAFLADTRRA